MAATGNPSSTRHEMRGHADAHSDAETELARHNLDLRIHALVMLCGAALAGYCGICIFWSGENVNSGVPESFVMSPDLLSVFAMAAFFAIAALSLVEAGRSWKKAAIVGRRAASRADAPSRPDSSPAAASR